VQFFKYEGLGNDFIVVDAPDERHVSPDQARALCDRHFGIGADGVLLVLPARDANDARMRVINSDGSIPENCGNGIRCVALHVARGRGIARGVVRVDTDSGPSACTIDDEAGKGIVTVDMGVMRVMGERTVHVDGRPITVTAADAGNPHAVLIGAFARGDVDSLGPRLATHPEFPRGTNVEFARVDGGAIDLVVWERGVGVTMACGTGACATVAVACAKGLVGRGLPIAVRLPGGRLDITIDDANRATMRGPARRVFAGSTP
jgi:diaminopimelate epimerase